MDRIYGDCAWPFWWFERMWRELEAAGDEIAWHPHLWRWSDEHGCWYQETEDEAWIRECLEAGYQRLCAAYGGKIEVCRMGWEFHSAMTMQAVDRLGVRMDVSAVPGRRRGPRSDRGSMRHGALDWEGTGRAPYHPCALDHRRPARNGEPSLRLLEVPRSVAGAGLWGGVHRLRRIAALLRTGRLREALEPGNEGAYVHAPMLTSPPIAYRRLVTEWTAAQAAGADLPFVTAFHADELLARARTGYSAANALRNLRYALRHLAWSEAGRGDEE